MTTWDERADEAAGDVPGRGGSWRDDRSVAERLDAAISERDWSVPADGAVESRFAAPSGSLAVVSLGDPANPRVVLLPGVTGSKEDFVLVSPLLAEAGYFVQSVDLAGQYESAEAGPKNGGHYDYELFVDDVIAFLETGGPAHLLGYSFAGIVAEIVALRRPDLVASLTLMATPPDPGDSFRRMRWVGWLSPFLSGHQGAGLMIWGVVTNKNKVGPQRLAFVRSRFDLTTRVSVDDIIGLMKQAPDLRDELAASGIPLFVAVGERDLWPVRRSVRFATWIGAKLAIYRTGHSPCEATPYQLAHDMLRFFAAA